MFRKLLIFLLTPLLAACAIGSTLEGANIPSGPAAYQALAAPAAPAGQAEYHIAPFDALAINVLQEPDLSTAANAPLQVDASGNINVPLLGTVAAAGQTTDQLASVIAAGLARKYLKNPQVTVAVSTSVPQKITVQGEVNEPGIFDVKTKTSLLQAIALAKGETKLAATNQIAVFREVNGQRMGALFNIDDIRRGTSADPLLLADDVVIVGHSRHKEALQNIMSMNPLFGVFRAVSAVGPVIP